jgi:hypothetical protein
MPMSVARTYALRQVDQAMTPVIYLGHAILGRTFQLHTEPMS